MSTHPARRWNVSTWTARTWTVLAVTLAAVALVAAGIAVTGQQAPPQPTAGVASLSPDPTFSTPPAPPSLPATGTPATATPEAAAVAEPVTVSIQDIGVSSDLLRLGLDDDGAVEVPPLGPDDQAGWYDRGPAPGEVGPAVLLGHVDSAAYGPGVFFDLGRLQPGAEVVVGRTDGSRAVFAVDRVERHPKDDFPTIEAYGNTPDPQLRLITCGGDFDSAAGSYLDNVIVFATLARTEPA
ncbi:class F sortase [Klenkia sp. PcliD-1-E]|uniref:class F sortase n=1 Tax=Klenkia sp. PcliD-1-E TaxID=2954492 RepID=UPI002096D48D|nr:class F sortase [Klenkia sp. PcliD-1-E]MCO7221516.1 class F sortase [Klenkia sp. PcliD-1-E]